MLQVSIIGAIELAIGDVFLPLRAFAFYKLRKFWTASRSGDLTGLNPSTLRMTEHGLCGMLDRTKTSGPGKRVRFLPIFISRRVYFVGWVGAGASGPLRTCDLSAIRYQTLKRQVWCIACQTMPELWPGPNVSFIHLKKPVWEDGKWSLLQCRFGQSIQSATGLFPP